MRTQEQKPVKYRLRTYDETTEVKVTAEDKKRWMRELQDVSRNVVIDPHGAMIVVFDQAKLGGRR